MAKNLLGLVLLALFSATSSFSSPKLEVVAVLSRKALPRDLFLPSADGSRIYVVRGFARELAVLQDGKPKGTIALKGEHFDSRRARFVDLAWRSPREILALDAGNGHLWPIEIPSGEVGEPIGQFLSPQEVSVAQDGRIYVRDGEIDSVSVFLGSKYQGEIRAPEGLGTAANAQGEVPFLMALRGETWVDVGSRGLGVHTEPSPKRSTLNLPPEESVLAATHLGYFQGWWSFALLSQGASSSRLRIYRFSERLDSPPEAVFTLPWKSEVRLRQTAQGEVWGMQQSEKFCRIFRLPLSSDSP